MTLRRNWLILLLSLVIPVTAWAQATTATLRGHVTDESGRGIASAEINAVSPTTGFVHTVRSASDGSYLLAGLTPGRYNVIVAAPGREPVQRDLEVRVGQTVDADFRVAGTLTVKEAITVVGSQVVDMKATEAGTNVTPQQIEALPQPERNFLNFAQLAPGVSLSTNPERKTFSANGLDPEQTNVFIDGVSFKNDVLLGGFTGGDASRGNPFPQNAVQEFRVLTNNFSAEYDHASSAVITAVTKSGTNQLDGNAFVYYLPKRWISTLEKGFGGSTLTTNPDYRRYQGGISVGGPIIRDHLQYFASYEGTDEHAITTVAPGTPAAGSNFPSNINLASFAGTFTSPFRGNLAFGKVSWAPLTNQLVDFEGSYRKERDIRGFGGQASHEVAENVRNWVYDITGRHQLTGQSWLNQASLSWQNYGWNPTSVTPNGIRQNFFGVISFGVKDTTQRFEQRRIELRDKFMTSSFKWMGDHTLQAGGNADLMRYNVQKCLDCNPIFNFRVNPADREDFSFPFEAFIGFGDPNLKTSNNEYGIWGEDNWLINERLTATIGLRWDYETNMIDKSYVTPADIRTALASKLPASYFSTGSERKPYKGEWQPRVGFSYDLWGNSRSAIFANYGRYYDRLFLNATLDERFRLQFPVFRIGFSNPNSPPVSGKVVFNPSFLSAEGLRNLIAQGGTRPEIFLLNNNTKPPYSNEWNVGYRQSFLGLIGSASYNVVRGYRGFTWLSATGICCTALVPGFGNVIISDPSGKRFWYDALHATLERPYVTNSHWGVRVAWTHAKATQNGNDLFSLDYPSAAEYPRHIVPGSERDRIVGSGIFGLPGGFRFAALATLGSGRAQNVLDFTQGFSLADRLKTHPFSQSVYPPKENGFAERTLDLTLEKDVPTFGKTSIGVRADVFNVFNNPTFGCLREFYGPGDPTPTVGEATAAQAGCVTNLGRRYQLGFKVGF